MKERNGRIFTSKRLSWDNALTRAKVLVMEWAFQPQPKGYTKLLSVGREGYQYCKAVSSLITWDSVGILEQMVGLPVVTNDNKGEMILIFSASIGECESGTMATIVIRVLGIVKNRF